MLFVDASFLGEMKDSKSTTGAIIVLVGPRTFVTIGWVCRKQGAVSHSSSEAEVIALEGSLRMEGLPALLLWEEIYGVFAQDPKARIRTGRPVKVPRTLNEYLSQIDYIPCTLPMSQGFAKLIVMEDNEAVIKMSIKGRSPAMRHVPRTHKICLDWLFERLRNDPGLRIRYVGTKFQLGDILTKGQFSTDLWKSLLQMANVVEPYNALTESNPGDG
jgi:hypothetical protein